MTDSEVFSVIELINIVVKDLDVPSFGTVPLDTGEPLTHAAVDLPLGDYGQAACGTAVRTVRPTMWSWFDPQNDLHFPRCTACLKLYPLESN